MRLAYDYMILTLINLGKVEYMQVNYFQSLFAKVDSCLLDIFLK